MGDGVAASADQCEHNQRTSTLDELSAKHAQIIDLEHVYRMEIVRVALRLSPMGIKDWVSPAWFT